jgi:hypothetical protein
LITVQIELVLRKGEWKTYEKADRGKHLEAS